MYVELPPFQRVRSSGGPTLEDAAGREAFARAPGTPRATLSGRGVRARAQWRFSRLTVKPVGPTGTPGAKPERGPRDERIFIQLSNALEKRADSRRRHIVRAVPDAPPTNMSAFTVSAVAAPGAAKFASRNANARARRRARARRPPRPPRRPAGGRQSWPLGRGQEGTRDDALGDRRCPIEDARLRSRATSTFSVGATGKRARGRGPFHLTRSRSKRRRDGFFRTMPSPHRNPRVRIELPDARRETRRAA